MRLEVSRICGPAASAIVDVRSDGGKHTVVEVNVTGASAKAIANLEEEMKPLPQTYIVRAAKAEGGEAVTLAVEGGIATLTLNRPESLNSLSRDMMSALEEKLAHLGGTRRASRRGGDRIRPGVLSRRGPDRVR